MEKKGSRLVQPVIARGAPNSSDSKKNQDAGGKLWPKGGRRSREPTGGSLSAKSESLRNKSQPQHNNSNNNNSSQRTFKTFDNKRPRQRGTFNAGSTPNRTETARLDYEHEAELGSVFVPGSKKQSLNHLLNFVYVSYADEAHEAATLNNTKAKNKSSLIGTKKHKYNKEHFLQANCQFVVNSKGDYRQYSNNPDALVDWHLIEQVNVQVSELPSCPICLYPPLAAKITRCGHIYCWSCLLHYLSLSDKSWRKCPICFESVDKSDLKSVITIPYRTFNVDDTVAFQLMKRPKGSLIAYPADAVIKDNEQIILAADQTGTKAGVYAKLLLGNQREILTIIQRELDELSAQLLENGDCPEKCFTEQALVLLNERRDRVLDEALGGEETSEVGVGDNSQEDQGPSVKMHYFYQASDGQHLYLHALNARMLEHTYGSLEFGPKTLSGKILEKEGGSMTEDIRKRLRYLQHLPVTCQFEVAEIRLKEPTVDKETLEYFGDQIETRRKRRQRRAKDERKREKKIAAEENRMLGIKYPAPDLHLESQLQFPTFDPKPRTESECSGLVFDDNSSESPSVTPCSSLTTENEYAGPSFAKMLASAKKSENKWPELKAIHVEPQKVINVTGQKIQSSSNNSSVKTGASNGSDDEVLEGYDPVPSCSRSFGDAIVEALHKAEVDVAAQNDDPLVGKKKKKKNKQKILFTTNVAFSDK